jgi:phosphoribosyl 1,2-cyclic phosphate phosphodiesterase
MIRAIILGSGTSNGVPTLGVDYPPEFLANPKNHRTRPSLLLRRPEGDFLVDCTPEMRLQLLRAGCRNLEAVLITHTHADHVMGMDDLRSFVLKNKRDMVVYAYPDAQRDIQRIFPYAFGEFPPGIEVPRYELRDVPSVIEIYGMRITTFQVWHGKTPVVGIRVGDFAYITDVSEIPEAAWQHLEGLETLVLDAVRRKPHPNHFHFDRAIEVAQQIGARQTYFTHLSHDYDHDVTNSELPPGIALAYDGLEIPVA